MSIVCIYTIIPINEDENWIFENISKVKDCAVFGVAFLQLQRVLKVLRPIDTKGWMKCSVLFETEEIFYLLIEQKAEYINRILDVKCIHSRKLFTRNRNVIMWYPEMGSHIQ